MSAWVQNPRAQALRAFMDPDKVSLLQTQRSYRIRARMRFSASADQYLQSRRMKTDE